MRKFYYTIWFKEPQAENATLLMDEPLFLTKRNSFKRARDLASRPEYNGCIILVRKVSYDSPYCLEWEFDTQYYQ